jgi:hypothetical protein
MRTYTASGDRLVALQLIECNPNARVRESTKHVLEIVPLEL